MDDKYKKTPNPKEMYSRFKQRLTHEPTEQQVDRWEYEGGSSPREADQAYVHTLTLTERVKYYAGKLWKIFHKPYLGFKT